MTEPKFTPQDGQLDYTNIRYAPVVNTVVARNGKILLVKRSSGLRLYPDYWNGISGFLDDNRSIEEKVYEELNDELSFKKADVLEIKRGEPILQEAPEYGKTWLVVPVLAKVKSEKFSLDWEAKAAKWFSLNEVKKLKLLPGFIDVLSRFFKI